MVTSPSRYGVRVVAENPLTVEGGVYGVAAVDRAIVSARTRRYSRSPIPRWGQGKKDSQADGPRGTP